MSAAESKAPGAVGESRYVALLRGINVGTAKQLAMADLKALVEGLGHTAVKTHLRSGQVVFTAVGSAKASQLKTAAKLASDIEHGISKDLGMAVPVVVRSRDELAAVTAANELAVDDRDLAKLFAVFLSEQLTPKDLTAVDPATYAPEEFVLGPGGREIFLWLPNGMGTSKLGLVKWDRVTGKKGLIATARNWRTTLKLLELLDG